MAKLTIHLPTAPPQAYLAWVTWWREVEELLGSDMAQAMAAGDDDAQPLGHGVRSIVPEHVRLLEQQARQALADGTTEISPELSADPEAWDQWLDYWGRRREWLEALALRGLPVPQTPKDLAALWQKTLRAINVELAIDLAHLKNLELLGTGQPGSFRLSGELDLMNVEAVSRYLQGELRSGQRLTLDVSGLTFIDSKGLVRSSDAACVQSRKVMVKRVKKGPDRVVGHDVTNDSGAYRVPAQNPSGRFYAVTTKKAGGASGGGNCLKALSKKVRR